MGRWRLFVALAACALCAAPAGAARPTAVGGTVVLADAGAEFEGAPGSRAGAALALLPGALAVGEPGASDVKLLRPVTVKGQDLGRGLIATFTGAPGTETGAAVAAVGSDLLIGAPQAFVAGRGNAGAAYLVLGAVAAGDGALGAPRLGVVTIDGAAAGDSAGAAVASVPDVDGDSRPDLVIGAPGAGTLGRPGAGAAFIVLSTHLQSGAEVDLARPDAGVLRIDGPRAGARAGTAVAGADVDGSDRGDAVIGAPGADSAFVVHPSPQVAAVDLGSADAPALALVGLPGESAGAAVTVPGDLDGDGLDEVAVGAPDSGGGSRKGAGAVYVARGRAAEGAAPLSRGGWVISGAAKGERAGASLASGDLDGVAPRDLLIGAPGAQPLALPDAGAAYVVFGRTRPLKLALLNTEGVRLAGAEGSNAGGALAGGVDVDGAAGDDVAVGGAGSAALLSAPRRPAPIVGSQAQCNQGLNVVLDNSQAMADSDPDGLRGEALKLLLAQPANSQRVVGAVEAAMQPAVVFTPVETAPAGSSKAAVVNGLVDEAVQPPDAAPKRADLQEGSPRRRGSTLPRRARSSWPGAPPSRSRCLPTPHRTRRWT